VGHVESATAVPRLLDLVDDRLRQVGSGDMGFTLLISQQHIVTDAVLPGDFLRVPSTEQRGWADVEPVERLRSPLERF